MRRLTKVALAGAVAVAVVAVSQACARSERLGSQSATTREAASQDAPMGAQHGMMGTMMGQMDEMHGRLHQMGNASSWMHDGEMRPGANHMMALSNDLGGVADAMRGAMGQMQSLGQGESSQGPIAEHLDQMQRHMQQMNDDLGAMTDIMAQVHGGAQGAPSGTGGMHAESGMGGSMGPMMEHMGQMHGRLAGMSDPSQWMHGGQMMSGAQHMTALSADLATMANGMREAMGEMQTMMQQPDREEWFGPQHLEQMRRHMEAMSEQLDLMTETMGQVSGSSGE